MEVIAKLKKRIRDKDTAKSMFLNFIIKGTSLVLTYIYVPLLLDYLGDEKYGLWATLLSILTWINLCDVGIGGGLRNILTAELSEGKKEDAKKSVSTAYAVLSILSFFIWGILCCFTLLHGWDNVFLTTVEMDLTVLISATFISINFVLSLVNIVLYALHVSEQVGFINLFGNIINIVGIIILRQYSQASLEGVAIAYGLSTLIPLMFNNIRIFKKYSYLSPDFKYFDRRKTNGLLSLGVVFFILQIGGLMLSTTDNIIISRLFGAVEVTPIEISNKLLSILKGFFAAMMIPVWSRTTKAVVENDHGWLKHMYKQLLMLLLIFGLGISCLVILFKPITYIWLHKELAISTVSVIIIALGAFAEMINTAYYNMLNGMNLIKFQMYIAIIQIIVNIPLSIFLAKNIGMGVIGVKLATTVLFAFSGITYVFYTKHSINKLGKIGGTR